MADQSMTLDAVLALDHLAQHIAAESRDVIREALGLVQDRLIADDPDPVGTIRKLRRLLAEDSIGLRAVLAARFEEAPPDERP